MAQATATRNQQERTNRLMIGAAVLFAAIAAILLFVALQSRGGGDETAVPRVDVVVAAQSIDANTKITADMLELRSLPSDQLLSGAYGKVERVVGLPVRFPIQTGEQITTSKIGVGEIADENDLALVLQPGQRAFAVEATEVTAVGGLLLPGNFVDVVAVFEEQETGTGGDQAGEVFALTVLQSIEVLGVAQEAQEPVPAASEGNEADGTTGAEVGTGVTGQRPEEVERQPGARSITLAVTPEQAQLLAALQVDNSQFTVSIWLSLRPVDDNAPVSLNETNLLPFQ